MAKKKVETKVKTGPLYEYHVADIWEYATPTDIINVLNELGKENWKLVDVFNHRRYTFIRRIDTTDGN